jgi:YidC/Oxa1 family membrane protein insertase
MRFQTPRHPKSNVIKMDRNFLLAFIISTGAIFLYYTLFPPEQRVPTPDENKPALIEEAVDDGLQPADGVISTITSTGERPAVIEPGEQKTVTVESPLYRIRIDSLDGVLKSYELKRYQYASEPHFNIKNWVMSLFWDSGREPLPYDPNRLVDMAGDLSPENRVWQVKTGTGDVPVNYRVSNERIEVKDIAPETLVLEATLPSGLSLQKIWTFQPDSYLIDYEIRIVNQTGQSQTIAPQVNFGAGNEAIEDEPLPKPKVGITFAGKDFEKYKEKDFINGLTVSGLDWAGAMDTYFVSVFKSAEDKPFQAELLPLTSTLNGKPLTVPKVVFKEGMHSLADGQAYIQRFQLYTGPKLQDEMEKFALALPESMDLGWFDFLAHPLLSLLRWLQGYVVNWGVAIILLTIIVRAAMFPLAYKGMVSMRKMGQLNPKIKAIRDRYKDNKERMNKEIMQFYKQHKVNPMGGCLPLLLQIPIFIALYQALLPAIELRHTPFMLWLDDLSAPDHTLILPILMGASMFLQQSLAPMPTMDPMQAKIMKWMPVMLVLFFLGMPSGLVLYWVISNMISVLQQLYFNRINPISPEALISKGAKPAKNKDKPKKKGK